MLGAKHCKFPVNRLFGLFYLFSETSAKQQSSTTVSPFDKTPHALSFPSSQNVQKSPKLARPKSPIHKLKDLWKSSSGSVKPPQLGAKFEGSPKKKHVNFDNYQIYQLSENVVISALPGETLQQSEQEDSDSVSFYLDQNIDDDDNYGDNSGPVLTFGDSVSQTVEPGDIQARSAENLNVSSSSNVLTEQPSETHADHPHHCLGYEVHPLSGTNSSDFSLAQIAKTQHVIGEYKCVGGGSTHDRDQLEASGSSDREESPITKSRSQLAGGKAQDDKKTHSPSEHGLHKVRTAPAKLPNVTIMPATPEVYVSEHNSYSSKFNTIAGFEFALNENNVYSLPLPDDVVNPSSPTNITPTKLSSSPAKSGIPFSGSTMARRSSESDLSTPPKGKLPLSCPRVFV